jgi:hypothetical protein
MDVTRLCCIFFQINKIHFLYGEHLVLLSYKENPHRDTLAYYATPGKAAQFVAHENGQLVLETFKDFVIGKYFDNACVL